MPYTLSHSIRQKKRYKERRKEGLCINCTKKARPSRVHCTECAKKNTRNKKKRRKERRGFWKKNQ